MKLIILLFLLFTNIVCISKSNNLRNNKKAELILNNTINLPPRKPIGNPVEVKNLNAHNYQIKFDELVSQGYRPIKISVKRQQVIDYVDGERPQVAYFATFQKFENDYAWVARHNLSADQYQAEFNIWTSQGYMPTYIGVGVAASNENEYYAVIFDKLPQKKAFVARHNISLQEFNNQHRQCLRLGFKLMQKVHCYRKGKTIYAGIWTK